jgi:hypothetical protein
VTELNPRHIDDLRQLARNEQCLASFMSAARSMGIGADAAESIWENPDAALDDPFADEGRPITYAVLEPVGSPEHMVIGEEGSDNAWIGMPTEHCVAVEQ